jgi:acyl-CoA dehydrogenase
MRPGNFEAKPEHSMVRRTASEIADQFGPEYWQEKERAGEFD